MWNRFGLVRWLHVRFQHSFGIRSHCFACFSGCWRHYLILGLLFVCYYVIPAFFVFCRNLFPCLAVKWKTSTLKLKPSKTIIQLYWFQVASNRLVPNFSHSVNFRDLYQFTTLPINVASSDKRSPQLLIFYRDLDARNQMFFSLFWRHDKPMNSVQLYYFRKALSIIHWFQLLRYFSTTFLLQHANISSSNKYFLYESNSERSRLPSLRSLY